MRDMPMMLTCSSRRNSIWRRTAAGGLWGTAWTSHIHLCRQICELRDKFRGFSKTNETGRNSRKCLTYGNKTWIMNLWSVISLYTSSKEALADKWCETRHVVSHNKPDVCFDGRYLLWLLAEKSHIHISKNQTQVRSAVSNNHNIYTYYIQLIPFLCILSRAMTPACVFASAFFL